MPSCVVAIAGGSASGKSTLAQAVMTAIESIHKSVEVVPMDRFMRRDDPSAPHFEFQFGGTTLFSANHPDSVDNAAVLDCIGRSEADVVVLEGLMALAVDGLRQRADIRIFIELEADIRAVRRVERDIRTKRGNGDPAFIAAYYIECARVGHEQYVEPSRKYADFIVRGDGDFARVAGLIAKLVADN